MNSNYDDILAYLQEQGGIATTKELRAALDIPANSLPGVLSFLKKKLFVDTYKEKGVNYVTLNGAEVTREIAPEEKKPRTAGGCPEFVLGKLWKGCKNESRSVRS